jgi:hypothetical protein
MIMRGYQKSQAHTHRVSSNICGIKWHKIFTFMDLLLGFLLKSRICYSTCSSTELSLIAYADYIAPQNYQVALD